MRFRVKSVPDAWFWCLICGINVAVALDRILSPRHSRSILDDFMILVTTASALLLFYSQRITFWEMDADGLRHRRLWTNIRINWRDVTRVVSMWSGPFDLRIEYNQRRFGPRIGCILTNPEDRDAFLASLRLFAPQAQFVDESRKTILSA